MNNQLTFIVTIALMFLYAAVPARAADGPTDKATSPNIRIESVVPLAKQPHEQDPATIWYDDFNGPDKQYGEASGNLDASQSLGGTGSSLASVYAKGSQGVGNRKVFFGDSPSGKYIARRGEKFNEIYWRIYVKHQWGWTGGGEAKLSRATSLTSEKWTQAMIAHVWSGKGDSLTLDPATGVSGDQIVTTRYNDFDRLHWLGNKPDSNFKFSSPEESGWWVCVESYAKLNTPGQSDGINRLWIDGKLETQRDHLNWRGSYDAHHLNAVFLESYWNQGSPVDQTRWLDNFVISTKPIGPVICPRNPVLVRSTYHGAGKAPAWEVELSIDPDGMQVVWKSRPVANATTVKVESSTGEFVGSLAGRESLAADATYYCRTREIVNGEIGSDWTRWHQGFGTSN